MSTANDILNAALAYRRRGWAVLPLGPRSKEPHHDLLPRDDEGRPQWKPFAERPASESEIRRWFQVEPRCNVGVICGAASGNRSVPRQTGLVVADVDEPESALKHPLTPVARTRRGRHVYFQASEPVRTTRRTWGQLQGEGCYVVAPPSVHPSGGRYRWMPFLSPDEVDLAELPADLLAPQVDDSAPDPTDARGSSEVSLPYADFAAREDVAFAVLRRCGREITRLGATFLCPLPGHEETRPSAALWKPPDGIICLHDFHMRDGVRWYPLPDVYAAVATGETRRLGNGERAAWWLRALHRTGFIPLPAVEAPPLPQGAPDPTRRVYAAFVTCCGFGRPTIRPRTAQPPLVGGSRPVGAGSICP